MKKPMILAALATLFAASACKKEDTAMNDQTAPTITAAEGRTTIRPEHKEVMPATKDHMHVRFQVNDPSGISEVLVSIHHGFDGHSHGKTQGNFEHLSVRKIYPGNGNTRLNIDSNFDDIYWEGTSSVVTGNVLAGPYHFMVDAVDIHGNQTTAGANNNYMATVQIDRPYAPNVSVTNVVNGALEGIKNTPLDVLGSITKTADALSSDIVFLKIKLMEEDGHVHKNASGELFEAKWGTSRWTTDSGPALPNATTINFSDLLMGASQIILPNEHGHFELEIWAEDAEGNVTNKFFEVHVD
jgi:hypothetical protein